VVMGAKLYADGYADGRGWWLTSIAATCSYDVVGRASRKCCTRPPSPSPARCPSIGYGTRAVIPTIVSCG